MITPVLMPDAPSDVPELDYQALADAEAAWLYTQQLPNGAFATHYSGDGTVSVNPYFAAGAAIALTAYGGGAEGQASVKRFIDWYYDHMNTAQQDPNGLAGTIFDRSYTIQNGVIVSEQASGSYDSTDSYSALFLILLADYCAQYGDTSVLSAHDAQIHQLADVLFAGMENGYSYAKPDYKVMYLMDNAEVYAGLCSAATLFESLGDPEYAARAKSAAATYQECFLADWFRVDHFRPAIKPALVGFTSADSFSWNDFYPDAAAQVYPIVFGLVDTESPAAKITYASFCRHWDWQDMDYIAKGEDLFYWGIFARCAVAMGDSARLNTYLTNYTAAVGEARNYPLYCFDSAMVLLALVSANNLG